MLLHEEGVRPGWVHGDAVDAVADLPLLVRELARAQALVDRSPRLAAVVRAECPGCGDRDDDPVRIVGVDQDRVQAEAAGARLPVLARFVTAQPRELVPALAAVGGAEQRRVLDARVHRVWVVERRLEVPDARELPRVLRSVVPLVRAGHAVVGELVADRLPGLAAVVGALHDLAVPAGRLRRIQPVGISRRALEVVHLPAREERALDLPVVARPVRRENERTLACANEEPHSAH